MPFARDSQMIVHSEGMLGQICPAASCKPVETSAWKHILPYAKWMNKRLHRSLV